MSFYQYFNILPQFIFRFISDSPKCLLMKEKVVVENNDSQTISNYESHSKF